MKKIISVFLILILILSVISCSSNEGNEPSKEEEKKEEKKEEANKEEKKEEKKEEQKGDESAGYGIVLKDLEGNKVKLSDFKGKKVYMEFMATWWGFCISGLGEAEKVSTTDTDFEVMYIVSTGFSRELKEDEFKEWVKGLEYKNIKFYIDDGGEALKAFSVRAFPTNVILNSEGKIVFNQPGLLKIDQISEIMNKTK